MLSAAVQLQQQILPHGLLLEKNLLVHIVLLVEGRLDTLQQCLVLLSKTKQNKTKPNNNKWFKVLTCNIKFSYSNSFNLPDTFLDNCLYYHNVSYLKLGLRKKSGMFWRKRGEVLLLTL